MNEKGFTFIESLFQLIIMSLLLQFIVLFFYWKQPAEKKIADYHETEWELFAIEMQEQLTDVTSIDILYNGRSVGFENSRGDIEIGKSGQVLRRKVDGQGYIPMFTNILDAEFTMDGILLQVKLTAVDGRVRERGFVIGFLTE